MTTYQNVMPGYLLNLPVVTTSSSMRRTTLRTSPGYRITQNWRVVPVPSGPGTSISNSARCVRPNSKQPNAQGLTPPLTARRLRCSPPEHRYQTNYRKCGSCNATYNPKCSTNLASTPSIRSEERRVGKEGD